MEDKLVIFYSNGHEKYMGTIVTGDQFIADKDKVVELKNYFGAWAVEMEGVEKLILCSF